MKFEHYKRNINGKITEKYLINDKEVSKEEYYKAINDERYTNKLDEYFLSSKKFNIFDVVNYLTKNPDFKAKKDNELYKINEEGILVNDKDNIPTEITKDTLNWVFELVPPETQEEWIDVDVKTAFEMLFRGETDKVRSINKNDFYKQEYVNNYCRNENYEYTQMISPFEIVNCKWQYLKKN